MVLNTTLANLLVFEEMRFIIKTMITTFQLSQKIKKTIFFSFLLMMLIIPFLFTWVNEELFEFNKMLATYVGVIFITGLWLGRMMIEQKVIFKKTYLDIPLILFLSSQLLSTIFSIHPRTSFFGYYTRFHGGLLSIIAYALLYWAAVSNLDKKQIKKVLFTALVAATGICLYAIPEHFGHSPSCWLIMQEFGVECWVQDVKNRIFGTFGQPNWLAAYLITLLPLNLTFYWQAAKKKTKLAKFFLLNLVLLCSTLFFTKSRSGFLGMTISLIYLVSVNYVAGKQKNIKKIIKNKQILGLVGIFAVLILLWGTPFTPNLKQIWLKINRPPTVEKQKPASAEDNSQSAQPDLKKLYAGSESGDIRQIVWKGALDIWHRYPIFGSGVETFAYSYYLDRPLAHNLVSEWDFLYNKAHNEFLNYLATTGILGALTYSLLIMSIIFIGIKSLINLKNKKIRYQNKDDNQITIALSAGIIALTVSNLLGFSTVMPTVLMFVFAASISVLNQKSEEKLKAKKTTPIKLTSASLLIPLLIIILYFLLNVWTSWHADYLFTKGKSLISIHEYDQGITKLQTALRLSPKEALFYDELASTYADIAVQFAEYDQATASAKYKELAIAASDQTFALNSQHLPFYKTRASMFSTLALLDPQYLTQAYDTLETATTLAPTNPKLVYQMALVSHAQNNIEQAIEHLKTAIKMKPNYHQARYKLAQIYEDQENWQLAQEQYQYLLDYLIPNDPNLKLKLQNVQKKIQQLNQT